MVHVLLVVVVVHLGSHILLYFKLLSKIYVYHLYHFTFLSSSSFAHPIRTFHMSSTSIDMPRLFAYVMIALLILPTLNYGPVSSMNSCLTKRNLSHLHSDVTWFWHDIQFVCLCRKLNN